MSRAFLKNESADDPVVIPARAPLPPGVANYVTPRGLALLRAELAGLETERAQVAARSADDSERMRQLAELNGRIGLLNQRIASARVVDPHDHAATDEVRFGATVTLKPRPGQTTPPERRLTLVGVDEADAAQGLIAFTAPIARAMQGKKTGDLVAVRTMKGEDVLQISEITY